jgi:hypothetical protein
LTVSVRADGRIGGSAETATGFAIPIDIQIGTRILNIALELRVGNECMGMVFSISRSLDHKSPDDPGAAKLTDADCRRGVAVDPRLLG